MTGFGAAFLVDLEAMPPPGNYLNAYEHQSQTVPWRTDSDGGAWRVLTLGEDIRVFEYRRDMVRRREVTAAPPGCLEGLLTRLDGEGAPGGPRGLSSARQWRC
ncbi:hypothetical protein CVT23_01060 [Minwuia thermotolerans]|uniref:Uncharacterized protein n=2 Tax=Minwuia thermotolerans TaxID=2056226 RepID=A0A2M9G7H3_9PROT|nr:hypothetical protein CVT23_01060 [Minwuia thermotolerans]